MNRYQGKLAVVTGASSGIGLAVAQALVREGMTVVGLARRIDKMEKSMENMEAPGKFYARKCDVSDEQQVIDAFTWIRQKLGIVRVLINNAGLATNGSLYETSRKDWEEVFGVNVMGLLECSKQAVIMMKEKNVDGHIVNINSVQGHRVYSFRNLRPNVYAATKHAVTAITETLRNDLMGGQIRVTSISPGSVKTDILARSGLDVRSSNLPAMEPEDIADAVLYVIGTPQHVQVTELTIRPTGEVRS